MGDDRTTVTETVTGLGMFGFPGITMALRARPAELEGVDEATWERLERLHFGHRLPDAFAAAFANGQAFLAAQDGLRCRRPAQIEWKGGHRVPGDEVVPADLRIDHVYLVSCKYLSQILTNAAPAYLFDRLLTGGQGRRGPDWYGLTAPAEYQSLYHAVRLHLGDATLPETVAELDASHRAALKTRLRGQWPVPLRPLYRALCVAVAHASVRRWQDALDGAAVREQMLWRLLRIGSAPYFVLGSGNGGQLRLRVATPWDWRQHFVLRRFQLAPQPAGQPRVSWHASVVDRRTGDPADVEGHVEIRWSHGRFCGPPEAKVYLDTPHHLVPGYFELR
ncbi:MAG: hypothetical protein IT196_09795 [Acidimicrobiales bacterium]|nr:hypothetical protein [Acidimicrobiales bacterium]